MKGLILLADGFEDVEALATVDILRRAKIDITLVGVLKNDVTTSSNIKVSDLVSLNTIDYKKYDFLVIPGGKAVFNILNTSFEVAKIIDYFCFNNKLTCAICAAPSLIGKLGYLRDKNYTVFPGCGENIIEGNNVSYPVVKDGNIITARSMYYSCDFALKIVESICGIETSKIIEKQIKGEI